MWQPEAANARTRFLGSGERHSGKWSGSRKPWLEAGEGALGFVKKP